MDVPPYLIPVKVGNMFSFKEMGDGDGRNQELFNYILTLQQKGLKKDEVIETLRIINEYVFKDSLPDSELRTMMRLSNNRSSPENSTTLNLLATL